jgi:hypothetical protein
VSSGRLHKQAQYYLESATVAWAYLPEEDAWQELQSPALGGTFALAKQRGIAVEMLTFESKRAMVAP